MDSFSIVGWIGAVLFVIAYFLLSFKKLSENTISYHTLNAIGAICFVINSLYLSDKPNLFVNAIWFVIAAYSCLRIIVSRKKKAN